MKRARELQPDLVVLDIEMPRMDGLTALPQILEAAPRTRVVMASTLTQKGAQSDPAGALAGCRRLRPQARYQPHGAARKATALNCSTSWRFWPRATPRNARPARPARALRLRLRQRVPLPASGRALPSRIDLLAIGGVDRRPAKPCVRSSALFRPLSVCRLSLHSICPKCSPPF